MISFFRGGYDPGTSSSAGYNGFDYRKGSEFELRSDWRIHKSKERYGKENSSKSRGGDMTFHGSNVLVKSKLYLMEFKNYANHSVCCHSTMNLIVDVRF